MGQPTKRGVTNVHTILTNILHAYMQNDADFIANRVFPSVPVALQAGEYFRIKKDDWFRSSMERRAPGTESAGGGFDMDDVGTYNCKVWALHKDIADQTRKNQVKPMDLDRTSTLWLGKQAKLRAEKEFVSKYFVASIWTGSSTGGDITPTILWDAANSIPVDDVDTQKQAMKEKTGRMPNRLVLGPYTFKALKNNDDILERIKYSGSSDKPAMVTTKLLAEIFEVDEVFVAYATENTAKEGQTAVMSYLFGKHAMLAYASPTPSILEPSAGYMFRWSEYVAAKEFGSYIDKFYMRQLKSDRLEVEDTWDMKQVAADLGVFFKDTVS